MRHFIVSFHNASAPQCMGIWSRWRACFCGLLFYAMLTSSGRSGTNPDFVLKPHSNSVGYCYDPASSLGVIIWGSVTCDYVACKPEIYNTIYSFTGVIYLFILIHSKILRQTNRYTNGQMATCKKGESEHGRRQRKEINIKKTDLAQV